MDGQTVSAVTEFLVNLLMGCFSLAVLTWVGVGVQTFINDRKEEKRKREQEKRDEEYHAARMKEYLK